MKEIRRRTRVVGVFPDGHSAIMLVGARLRYIAGTKWGIKDIYRWTAEQKATGRTTGLKLPHLKIKSAK